MTDQDKRDAFARLEEIKNKRGLDSKEKDDHIQLVRDLGGVVHAEGVYYICYENQQPCDPQKHQPGCTCVQMTY